MQTPLHLILGPLGVGKTTTLLRWLNRLAENEDVAVIVNDFGKVGIDAAHFRSKNSAGQVSVKNVPGGCLCCTVSGNLETALEEVLKMDRFTRVMLEPSGMSVVPDLLQKLRLLAERLPFEIRPTIGLIHPKRITRKHYEALPFFRSLIEGSDILVANRVDECSKAQMEHFREWTATLDPPKLAIYETSYGVLPDSILELRLTKARDGETAVPSSSPDHLFGYFTGGFASKTMPVLSSTGLQDWIKTCSENGLKGVRILRLKAIVPTERGWELAEIANGQASTQLLPRSDETKVEWISEQPLPEATVRKAFRLIHNPPE